MTDIRVGKEPGTVQWAV